MDLVEVGELGEGVLVSEGNEDDAVVDESREGGDNGALLSSSKSSGGDEDTSVLAGEASTCPQATGGVPESLKRGGRRERVRWQILDGETYLPLTWEVTVTSGNADQESIVRGKNLWGDDGVVGFGGGVELLEDLIGERLRDPARRERSDRVVEQQIVNALVDIDLSSCTLDTAFNGLGHC